MINYNSFNIRLLHNYCCKIFVYIIYIFLNKYYSLRNILLRNRFLNFNLRVMQFCAYIYIGRSPENSGAVTLRKINV